MADVRSGITAATTGCFTGPVGLQVGTPMYINTANGDVSFLLPGDVIYTIANGSQSIIAAMVFGSHIVPQPVNVQDANSHLATRTFDRQTAQQPQTPQDSQWQLANRVFSRATQQPAQASASDYLAMQSFAHRISSSWWQ